jgi:altronate hydrolase
VAHTIDAASPLIRLHANDNVLVARRAIGLGEMLIDANARAQAQVPAGHKIAARAIAAGAVVKKYDTVIGVAAKAIAAGEHVHTHNLQFVEFSRATQFGADVRPVDFIPAAQQAHFMGIVRSDGQVATRNYIGIISSVNCSATACRKVAEYFTPERLAAFPNVDGVVAFTHQTGCGMSTPSVNFDVFRRTLAGYARHPNLAAVLVIGLGCERNQIADFIASQGFTVNDQLQTFIMQEMGGTRETIAAAIEAVQALLPKANVVQRERVSAKHLRIGLQCGGSDGFSSISANPALGAAMDILVAHGGTAILSETPEIYGVEHMLARRAISPAVGQKLLDRITWWKAYSHGQSGQMNGVVVAGNQAGGIANIFEKSLGSAMKGGTTPLNAVYEFAEPIRESGFVFMDSPGFDPCSATGQIASGANMICFTTGRGSMFGAKPVPSIKLASNTPMFEKLKDDMDINCGTVIDGTQSMEDLAQTIFTEILRYASGAQTRSEVLGLGDNEFVPWQLGIVT